MDTNTVGFVLLGSAAVPALVGWDLSRRGLTKVDRVANETVRAAKELQAVAKGAQPTLARSSGEEAATVAQQSSEVIEQAQAVTTGVGEVTEALKAMTGVFAPARVFLALAFFLIVGAFVSFDLFTIGGT